jgi:fatty acid desaturase
LLIRSTADAVTAIRFARRVEFGAHAARISVTGLLVSLMRPYWYLVLPAMALDRITIVTMFAPMDECVHRRASPTRAANDAVAWIAGVLSVYNSTSYYSHAWHHRYTEDPERDPEFFSPMAANWRQYLNEMAGISFWLVRAMDYPRLALGRASGPPFAPTSARRSLAPSVSIQLRIYAAGAASIALGSYTVLYYWFLPAILAQPFVRALLIVKHTECSHDRNALTNRCTTLTAFPIRLLMWKMPCHAEHHLYPAVPFHRLPALHRKIRAKLAHIAPSYLAASCAVIWSL